MKSLASLADADRNPCTPACTGPSDTFCSGNERWEYQCGCTVAPPGNGWLDNSSNAPGCWNRLINSNDSNCQCGTAATNYSYPSFSYSGSFCQSGSSNPINPSFPAPGSSVSWTCSNGALTCSASQGNGFPPMDAFCSWKVFNCYDPPSTYQARNEHFNPNTGLSTWDCLGINGGMDSHCSLKTPVGGKKFRVCPTYQRVSVGAIAQYRAYIDLDAYRITDCSPATLSQHNIEEVTSVYNDFFWHREFTFWGLRNNAGVAVIPDAGDNPTGRVQTLKAGTATVRSTYTNDWWPYEIFQDQASLEVNNQPTVTCSVDGLASTTVNNGSSVNFQWSAQNASTCYQTPPPTGIASWDSASFSPTNGTLSVGPLVSNGSHTLGLTCTNPNGLATCATTVDVVPFNDKPAAQIDTPSAGTQPSPVDLQGTVTDPENDPIIAWEWRDNNCTTGTLLGNSEDPRRVNLSLGSHTIYFRAMDSGSMTWSVCDSVVVNINTAGYMRVWPDSQSKLVGEKAQFTAYYHPVTDIRSMPFADTAAILATGAVDVTATTSWTLTNSVPPAGQLTSPPGLVKGEVLGIAGGSLLVNANGPGIMDSATLSFVQPSLIICPQNPTIGLHTTYTALIAWYDPQGLKTTCAINSGSAIPVTEYIDAGNSVNNTRWTSSNNPPIGIIESGNGAGDFTSGASYGSSVITVSYPIGAPGAQTAQTTASVNCTPIYNCDIPPGTVANSCTSDEWTSALSTNCPPGQNSTTQCHGTRSCDFNWKEVAP